MKWYDFSCLHFLLVFFYLATLCTDVKNFNGGMFDPFIWIFIFSHKQPSQNIREYGFKQKKGYGKL